MDSENLNRYFQVIDEAFNKLEHDLLEIRGRYSRTTNIVEYEEALGVLTIEKSELEQQLKQKRKECEGWINVCHEVLAKLNFVIENISSVLHQE